MILQQLANNQQVKVIILVNEPTEEEQEATEAKQEVAQAKRKAEQLAERLRQLGVNPDELDELL